MDYSQLSNDDLLALKSGDYTKVSNEGLMSLKGQAPAQAMAETPKAPVPQISAIDMAMEKLPPQFKSAIETYKALEHVFNKGGEAVAETMSGKGIKPTGNPLAPFSPAKEGDTGSLKTSPEVAAAVGTGIQMIPDIASSIPMGGAINEGVKATGKAIAETQIGKAIRRTGAKEVGALTEQTARLPLQQMAKKELAEVTRQEAGTAINKAEAAMGIGQKSTSTAGRRVAIDTPEKIAKFADRGSRLAEKGADKLAEMATPESLQFYRKTAQDALSRAGGQIAKEARNKLYQINRVFGDAIAKTSEGAKAGFGEAAERYGQIQRVIDDLPKEALKERRVLKLALEKAKTLAKEQAAKRERILNTAKGTGMAALAAGGIKKLFF